MVFSSLEFIFIFLPIFFIIYYVAKDKYKNFIILIFSLLFYSFGEPVYILLLLLSSVVDYSNGFFINKFKDDKKKKRIFLIISIIVNLFLLGFFKYADFFIDNINLFGLNVKNFNLALPLGISFFTFQTMSYSIDVYKGNINYEKNFINYMAYVSMFPQLVAGPIVRYKDISKELKKRTHTFENYSEGLFRFLTGLFKKVLIANTMGYVFGILTSDVSSISLVGAWLGALSFALQIYFDFSGYSDMAIGLGKMMGFTYPENFNYPYIAESITDFWRRWHITMSTWFKDYVYIPLGGSKKGSVRTIINLFIVWFLTGLWHGASYNFIMWGLYFFIILIIEKNFISKLKLNKVIKHIYVIIVILISWVIFSFTDFNVMITYLKRMFINTNIIDNTVLFSLKSYALYYIIGIILSTKLIYKIKPNKVINILIGILYVIFFILTIASLVSDSYNPFLYFRF